MQAVLPIMGPCIPKLGNEVCSNIWLQQIICQMMSLVLVLMLSSLLDHTILYHFTNYFVPIGTSLNKIIQISIVYASCFYLLIFISFLEMTSRSKGSKPSYLKNKSLDSDGDSANEALSDDDGNTFCLNNLFQILQKS